MEEVQAVVSVVVSSIAGYYKNGVDLRIGRVARCEKAICWGRLRRYFQADEIDTGRRNQRVRANMDAAYR